MPNAEGLVNDRFSGKECGGVAGGLPRGVAMRANPRASETDGGRGSRRRSRRSAGRVGRWAAVLLATLALGGRADAAAPPVLTLHLVPGDRVLEAGRLPIVIHLVHRGGDPVKVAPLTVMDIATRGGTSRSTVRLAMQIDGRRVPVEPTRSASRAPADAGLPVMLTSGRMLTLEVELPFERDLPGARAVQAVYANSDGAQGTWRGALTSDLLRFHVGAEAASGTATRPSPSVPTTVPNRLLVDAPHLGGAPPGFRVTANGTGTTHAIELNIENPSPTPLLLRIPTGLLAVPREARTQTMVVVGAPSVHCPPRSRGRVEIPAYCTDRDLLPPPPTLQLALEEPRDERGVAIRQLAIAAHHVHSQRAQFLPTGMLHGATPTWSSPPAVTTPGPWRGPGATPAPGVVVVEVERLSAAGPFERSRGLRHPSLELFSSDPWSERPTVGTGLSVVALGPERASVIGPPSFTATAMLWTIWAFTNDDGRPNTTAIAERTAEQARGQGTSEQRAQAVARQVVAEIEPLVADSLERTEEYEELDFDFAALDLSLKGAPPAAPTIEVGPDRSFDARIARHEANAKAQRREVLDGLDPAPDGSAASPEPLRVVHAGESLGVDLTQDPASDPDAAPREAFSPRPPPAPLDIPTDWLRRREGGDPIRADGVHMRISGNRVEVVQDTRPNRYGGTLQWFDFGELDLGEGETLESVVRRAIAETPPKPARSELNAACARGALGTANARIVSAFERRSAQATLASVVREVVRSVEFSFEHAWIYDCATKRLERRVTIRFSVTENGRHVSDHVVDRLMEAESVR